MSMMRMRNSNGDPEPDPRPGPRKTLMQPGGGNPMSSGGSPGGRRPSAMEPSIGRQSAAPGMHGRPSNNFSSNASLPRIPDVAERGSMAQQGFEESKKVLSPAELHQHIHPVKDEGRVGGRLALPMSFAAKMRKKEQREQARKERWIKFKKSCGTIVNSGPTQAVTMSLTLFALVGDDIRLASAPITYDGGFDIMTMICLAIFAVEIMLASIGNEGYFLNFFFWLDLVSTGTLILDLAVVQAAMIGETGGDDVYNREITTIVEDDIAAEDGGEEEEGGGASGAESAQTARAGRVARVIRVIRLVRLIRIIKLYKQIQQQRQKREEEAKKAAEAGAGGAAPPMPADMDDEEMAEELRLAAGDESQVGKQLTDLSTRRVIILVLSMMFMMQFLQVSEDDTFASSAFFGVEGLYDAWRNYNLVCETNGYVLDNTDVLMARRNYEETLLDYIYYHDGKAADGLAKESCPKTLGLCTGTLFRQLVYIGVTTKLDTGDEWWPCWGPELRVLAPDKDRLNAEYSNREGLFINGELAPPILDRLVKPWRNVCQDWIGFSLSVEIDCPKIDLRFAEQTPMLAMLRSKKNENPVMSLPKSRDPRNFVVVFDQRQGTQKEAILNIIRTGCICVVLAGGAMSINALTQTLVLKPIERMVDKVKAISTNPLLATRIGDSESMKEEELQEKAFNAMQQASGLRKWWLTRKYKALLKAQQGALMETVVLEKTIIKIGGLLALGFGEAGADVIGQNLKGSSGEVKVLIPGRRMSAVFGLAKLKYFAIITEVLQSEVLAFVNYVAEIVHGFVDEFFGAPNKNLGESFVVVWRIPDHFTASSSVGPQVPLLPDVTRTQRVVCNFAVVSATKVTAAIRKSPTLTEYTTHPGLLQRLYSFNIEVTFGMHFGWAIEGAIGSEFKVDVSYLSTHVNMATRLETLSKELDVTIVMSEGLKEELSASIQERVRAIDRVMLSGFKNPIIIYTLDLDLNAIEAVPPDPVKREADKKLKKFKLRQLRETRKLQKVGNIEIMENVAIVFEADPDVVAMRAKYHSDFYMKFDMGYRNYVSGEWSVARGMLETTSVLLDIEDGPSVQLLSFMEQYSFKVPDTWQGYRHAV